MGRQRGGRESICVVVFEGPLFVLKWKSRRCFTLEGDVLVERLPWPFLSLEYLLLPTVFFTLYPFTVTHKIKQKLTDGTRSKIYSDILYVITTPLHNSLLALGGTSNMWGGYSNIWFPFPILCLWTNI